MAAVFVDFPKNKCNFLHKNKVDIARRVQFLTQGGVLWGVFLLRQSPPLPCGSRQRLFVTMTRILSSSTLLLLLDQHRTPAVADSSSVDCANCASLLTVSFIWRWQLCRQCRPRMRFVQCWHVIHRELSAWTVPYWTRHLHAVNVLHCWTTGCSLFYDF